MYIHRDARLVYLAHMKVGSRAVRDALRRRGFSSVYGHHGGPWHGRQQKFTNEPSSWWWNEDPSKYKYFTTVRNHFDIIRTFWYWQRKDDLPFPRDVDTLRAFMDRFTWGRVPHFHHRRRLFRFLQEVPQVNVWYYERQHEHLRGLINGYAPVEPLSRPWDHPWPTFEDRDYPETPDSAFVTAGKPRGGGGPWEEDYTPETRAWVEDTFEAEMAELGYTFEGRLPNHRGW